jgi:DNA polymerase III subunit alpha
VVIGDRPLDELVPLYQDPRSDMPATQFNMKWVEAGGAGEVRLPRPEDPDRDPERRRPDPAPKPAPAHRRTAPSFTRRPTARWTTSARSRSTTKRPTALRQRPHRRGVPGGKLGHDGRAAPHAPTCIEDIVALVALYRPGPMENIPAYCEVKNGLRERWNRSTPASTTS